MEEYYNQILENNNKVILTYFEGSELCPSLVEVDYYYNITSIPEMSTYSYQRQLDMFDRLILTIGLQRLIIIGTFDSIDRIYNFFLSISPEKESSTYRGRDF